MKKFNNISTAIEIVENINRHGCFKDEASENFAIKLTIDFLKEYDEIKKTPPKKNLKDKTLGAIEITHKIVDNLFNSLKETLNKKDDE